MKNITKAYEKYKVLAQGGAQQLQIISDFDRTISKYYLNSKNNATVVSEDRDFAAEFKGLWS